MLKWDKSIFISIVRLLPAILIEQIIMRVGFMLFAIIVNGLGTDDTYIQGVCNDINSLLFTLADGFDAEGDYSTCEACITNPNGC